MNARRLSHLFALGALLWFVAPMMGCTSSGSSDPSAQCVRSTDCGPGRSCVDTVCMADDVGLAPGEDDVGPLGPDCRVEACEEGLICSANTHRCEACVLDEQCQEYAVCNVETNRCACLLGFQYCGGRCLSLDSVESCGSECVPCPQVEHGDALCIERTCGVACDRGFFLCDDTCEGPRGSCVECLESEHCTDRSAPVCDRGSCAPCRTSADCDGFSDTPVCHLDTGTCVECSTTETQACGNFSCDPETHRCTQTPRRSLTSCQACRSDSECGLDHHCVPMEFAGNRRDSAYCLKLDSAGCDSPFTILAIKESISGAEMEIYCGINESLATCEAILDYGEDCSTPADCGHPALDDGFCEAIEFEIRPRCTYGCEASGESGLPDGCDEMFSCGMSGGVYCGGF